MDIISYCLYESFLLKLTYNTILCVSEIKKFIMGGKNMKKLLALLVVLTMVIGIMPIVSAAIPQNNGLGTALTFKEWSRNSPSSGSYCAVSTVEDATFGTATRYIANHTITEW